MSDLTKDEVLDYLSNLPVIELSNLIRELEGKWGVKAAPPVGMVQGGPNQNDLEPAPPAKTEWNVVLKSFPPEKKITLIKAVRETSGLGLKEAKDFIEALPKTLKEALSKTEADELAAKLKEAGGEVSVE
jgi:large subunit ribosomal protein L7/L12